MNTYGKICAVFLIGGLLVWGYFSPQTLAGSFTAIFQTIFTAIWNVIISLTSAVFATCYRGKSQGEQIIYSFFLVGLVVLTILFFRWVFRKKSS